MGAEEKLEELEDLRPAYESYLASVSLVLGEIAFLYWGARMDLFSFG